MKWSKAFFEGIKVIPERSSMLVNMPITIIVFLSAYLHFDLHFLASLAVVAIALALFWLVLALFAFALSLVSYYVSENVADFILSLFWLSLVIAPFVIARYYWEWDKVASLLFWFVISLFVAFYLDFFGD